MLPSTFSAMESVSIEARWSPAVAGLTKGDANSSKRAALPRALLLSAPRDQNQKTYANASVLTIRKRIKSANHVPRRPPGCLRDL
jgi:hypothetical protein